MVVVAKSCPSSDVFGYGSIYGVAAFGSEVFGFSRARRAGSAVDDALVVRISNVDGTGCLVDDTTAATSTGWAGAGVTTLAPVAAPPPK